MTSTSEVIVPPLSGAADATAAEAAESGGIASSSAPIAPPGDFAANAWVSSRAQYEAMYHRSLADPEGFWAEQAQALQWMRAPQRVLDWQPPDARWFADGQLNVSSNCLDRHVLGSGVQGSGVHCGGVQGGGVQGGGVQGGNETGNRASGSGAQGNRAPGSGAQGGRAQQAALIWEGEPGELRTLTYRQLWDATCRFANVLRLLGVEPGDRVAIYMGMVPEAVVAMLACARIGAVHTVIFGGFAADAVRDRLRDAGAKVVVTQDAAYRRGELLPLKATVDVALRECPSVVHTVVWRRIAAANNDGGATTTGSTADADVSTADASATAAVAMQPGRDHWWHELIEAVDAHCEAVAVDAEHPLFILYTSGTTGQPKGVLHTTGGYLLGATLTSKLVFDLRDGDVYWCTADIGWITGHSYVVYGPLSNGATVLLYEGAPNHPDPGRVWSIIERHAVTILYTAPTAVRAFMRWGEQYPRRHDLRSLRLLGSVGEPINPEAWLWYSRVIGADRCPVVDTWWQTETGSILMAPLPGAIATKPGSCCLPLFGVAPQVLRHDGSVAEVDEDGYLVLERPWPSMLRGVWGDVERYRSQYWSRFPGKYFTGDGARRDADGYFWVSGRVDDVLNVAGHRLGTAEIESALVAHRSVAEAAAVGRPDALKGQALVVFVTLRGDAQPSEALRAELIQQVAAHIGKFARPDQLRFAAALPKTRSGKIMRRLLRDLASGLTPRGDVSTLEDLSVLSALQQDE